MEHVRTRGSEELAARSFYETVLDPSRVQHALVVIASIAAGALPAALVLDRSGAIAFGCAATAWFMFARLIVAGVIAYPIARMAGERVALASVSVAMAVAAVATTMVMEPKLVGATLAAMVFSELFYMQVWFNSAEAADMRCS